MRNNKPEGEKALLEVPGKFTSPTTRGPAGRPTTTVSMHDLPPAGAPASFSIPEDGVLRFRENRLRRGTALRWIMLLLCFCCAGAAFGYGGYLLETRDTRDVVRRHAYMYFALASLCLLGVAYFALSLAGSAVLLDLNRGCIIQVQRGLGHLCSCCITTHEIPFDRLRHISMRPYMNESHKWTSIAVGYGKNPVAGSSNLSPAGSFTVSLGATQPGQGSSGSLNGSGEYPRDKSQTVILCSWPDARHIGDEGESTSAQTWQDRSNFVSYLARKINESGGCIRVKESV